MNAELGKQCPVGSKCEWLNDECINEMLISHIYIRPRLVNQNNWIKIKTNVRIPIKVSIRTMS